MDEVDDQAQAENPRHHRKIYRRQEVDLQRYFLDVHERQANGDQFPFNLEELVPTVYSQKVKAIQALTSGYTQDVDYIGFHRMVEDFTVGGGERNIITYHLTAATFEHLVDKNNRAIFEVYRRVFHAGAAEVIDSIAKLKIQLCKPLSTLHVLKSLESAILRRLILLIKMVTTSLVLK